MFLLSRGSSRPSFFRSPFLPHSRGRPPLLRHCGRSLLSSPSHSSPSHCCFRCPGPPTSHAVLLIRRTRFPSGRCWLSSAKLDNSSRRGRDGPYNFGDQNAPWRAAKDRATCSEERTGSSPDASSICQFSRAPAASPREATEESLKTTDLCGGEPDATNFQTQRARPKKLKRSRARSSRSLKQTRRSVQAILGGALTSGARNTTTRVSARRASHQKPNVQQVNAEDREAIEESKKAWEFSIKNLTPGQLSVDAMDYEGLKRFSKKNNLKVDDAFFGHFDSTSSLLFPSFVTTIRSTPSNDSDPPASSRAKPLFKDCIQVRAHGGNGGRGASTFYRDNRVSRGPPDGGNGGDGGSVVFVASRHLKSSLGSIRPVYRAGPGEAGGKNKKNGKKGNSVYVRVPLGTGISEVVRKPSPEAEDDDDREKSTKEVSQAPPSEVQPPGDETAFQDDKTNMEHSARPKGTTPCLDSISQLFPGTIYSVEEDLDSPPLEIDVTYSPRSVELNSDGDFFVAAQGGQGGLGNARLASARHRSRKAFTHGSRGETLKYKLELKLIADVGLIGYPNAGKSTLLAALSHAKPKIASYPFTTVAPEIGTVQFDDYSQLSIADLPGLAPHLNRGLGREFLRHAERTRVLCFVIDMSCRDRQSPYQIFEALWNELEEYGGGLMEKAKLVVANKIDKNRVIDRRGKTIETTFSAIQAFSEQMKNRREFKKLKIYPVSAQQGTNLQALAYALKCMLQSGPNRKNTTNEGDPASNYRR